MCAFVRPLALVRPRGTCRDFVRAFVRAFSLVRTSSWLKNPLDPSVLTPSSLCVCLRRAPFWPGPTYSRQLECLHSSCSLLPRFLSSSSAQARGSPYAP